MDSISKNNLSISKLIRDDIGILSNLKYNDMSNGTKIEMGVYSIVY